jgi:hypothetical protein
MPLSDDASAPGGVALSRMIHATWWTSRSSRAASLGHDAIHGLPNECVQMTRGETSGRPYRMGTWETGRSLFSMAHREARRRLSALVPVSWGCRRGRCSMPRRGRARGVRRAGCAG